MPTLGHLLWHAVDDARAWRAGGARAAPGVRARHGPTSAGAALFVGVPSSLRVWASHGDFVAAAPAGFAVAATSANAPVAAMQDPARQLYGLLFHPEVAHTDAGTEILHNFAFGVCGCRGDWTMASFVDESIARIRETVGEGRVVCGLSGGVDSTVAAMLLHRAIGDRLTCIFVDNGLLRLNEAEQVRTRFERLQPAAGVRRRARRCSSSGSRASSIRNASGRSSGRRSSTCSSSAPGNSATFDFLAQGTLYPDVIESVSVDRPVGRDQEPSQRRRAARAHAVHAGRAAA